MEGSRPWLNAQPSDLPLAITFLFVPQLVLSILSTLNLRSKNSLNILTRHPSLILLPVVTFFTFAKVQVGCSANESRVRFSKRFSWYNIGVSVVGYVSWAVWFYFRFEFGKNEGWRRSFYEVYLAFSLYPLVLSIILTALFLHLDSICCSECARVPAEEISVYDPSTDRRFIMDQETGKIIPVPEEDVETGNNPSNHRAEVQETDIDTASIVHDVRDENMKKVSDEDLQKTETTSDNAEAETPQEDAEDTEQMSVCDPSTDRRLVLMENGELKNEDDLKKDLMVEDIIEDVVSDIMIYENVKEIVRD